MNLLSVDIPVPKYWRLAEHLRGQLAGGELKPGQRLPSFVDMHALYGASRGTVEKAYSILEQEGLIERRNGTGIFAAEPPIRTATGVLGLSGPGFSFRAPSLYWAKIMEGICEAAEMADVQLMHLGHKSNHGWEKVDGVIVSDWDAQWGVRHLPPGLPCVSVLTPYEGISSVHADDSEGVRLAVEHLVTLGHRRISYLHSVASQNLAATRIDGYWQGLAEAGIDVEPDWTHQLNGVYDYGQSFVDAAHYYMAKWLESGWRDTGCTALICHNDDTAVGAMAALREAGFKVPGDVSVIGFDGTGTYDMLSPRPTSVEVPLKEIGIGAVVKLLEQVARDEIAKGSEVLPVRLRAGETCAPPRNNAFH